MSTMPLPHADTLVTYPNGSVSERATVLSVSRERDRTLVLTDVTPFHPEDPRWPDQRADRGTIDWGGHRVQVIDCVIGATDGTTLFVGDDVPVRRGEPGWAFVVVHVLRGDSPAPDDGAEVLLRVDAAHRQAHCAGHTGCHVAALALNAALRPRWRKDARTDGLANPDFDQLAIVSSRIEPDGAVDTYRIGKSLRKKGFDAADLADDLPNLIAEANRLLAGWVGTGAAISVEVSGPGLTDLREWVCVLPEGTQRIPCGGTHLRSLTDVAAITVDLRYEDSAGELTMVTSVRRTDRAAEPETVG